MGFPDYDERLAILKLHTAHMKLQGNVKLQDIAQRTRGLSGADLQKICTEALIAGLRDQVDTEEAEELAHVTFRTLEGYRKGLEASGALLEGQKMKIYSLKAKVELQVCLGDLFGQASEWHKENIKTEIVSAMSQEGIDASLNIHIQKKNTSPKLKAHIRADSAFGGRKFSVRGKAICLPTADSSPKTSTKRRMKQCEAEDSTKKAKEADKGTDSEDDDDQDGDGKETVG
uniref:AAA ATPase AAA+ lid domain-containing protein n=1 Tax=Chromera velia CCMP2878 TaxID=1169474 RepID=A0A0G4F8W3_9ALVE|eukprot:Cvel_2969.t1-p1 / transcript=Cvel_2969.t1 / gene=Cvel_2969 / organism=Chromera_velia_CCMP2878 / gene_product=Cell division cycle protein 48 homolog, putative / transcript_product=Cell division cycle protein 48 homolog, putative / location=Cvel_scaffold118:2186-8631(-) / protein_length=229 / sequence_SO=supercontig / SO=protein_coding / is_pseudo=false